MILFLMCFLNVAVSLELASKLWTVYIISQLEARTSNAGVGVASYQEGGV